MDIFFNELSVKTAANDDEATEWLENLAKLGKLLKQIIDLLEDDSFSFRRKEGFGQQKITSTQTILEFLISKFGHSDPVFIFLLGIFDSPYISEDDPQKTDYDLTSIALGGHDYELTGIAAAYLKDSLVVSLNNDVQWDECQLQVSVNKLNEQAEIITTNECVKHASQSQHIVNCHLPFLSHLYSWSSYEPKFDPANKQQSVLVLVEIYSLYLGEDFDTVWNSFYHDIAQLNTNQRVSRIVDIAEKISRIHGWEKATGSLERNNPDRRIYTIPRSDFIVSVDTQHGEFEIHRATKGNNHLGAISFDGKKFKQKIESRSLTL